MVVMYQIAGRQVGSHVLAMATLGTFFVGSWAATGGSKKSAEQGPPISAGSKDEEKFIQDFLKSAEAEEKKAAH
ncbi:uncharacterized protein BDZ99DRAFT_466514 [Mytilinidion resinicola]|uniref:ATP synthase subunit K, mitochondrial n=1 Tax=Mytilinidion resinicola TaxID=574789 RepID=A0A6A6YBZ0_9PEZI|nr:uncharacterized protein BDZ99DRAFT_466514 [Mytilinidion resinicola]KAF2805534.1 hypothetical protein BDZ99DRAFT_466514 [Mytilinidion resinicola]